MEKKIRKVGIFSAVATFLCSSVLGVAALSGVNMVTAEETNVVAMSTVIGAKTSNVSVTPAATKGDYSGLLVGPQKMTEEWSAELDTTFTSSAVLTYLLPDRADLSTQLGGDYKHQANAFSVKNKAGEIVASFVIVPEEWSAIGGGTAYMHNAVNDTYWIPYHHWDNALSVDYYASPNAINQMKPNEVDAICMDYLRSLSASYVAPLAGLTYTGGTLDSGTMEGTLTFEYADGTLTIKTSTYDVQGRDSKRTSATGNGQTLTVGTVQTDLSEGFTIMMHNAFDFGKEGDVNYYEHTHSSSVLLTSVNNFDTLAPEVTVTETENVISYAGEKVVDGKNVITLLAGEKLDAFDYIVAPTVENTVGDSIKLNGVESAVAFDYDQNKEFNADEEITITYGKVSKTYLVDVVLPSVDVDSLFVNESGVTMTVATEKGLGSVSGNTNNIPTAYNGVDVSPTDLKAAWSTQIGGTFYGNSSITYLGYSRTLNNGVYQANRFTVLDSKGNAVCSFVRIDGHWGSTGTSKAYVYNAIEDVYTSATTTWKTLSGYSAHNHWVTDASGDYSIQTLEVDTTSAFGLKTNIGNGYNDMHISPKLSSQNSSTLVAGSSYEGTVYFDYDEENKVLAAKTTTYNIEGKLTNVGPTATGGGQIVTFGKVNVDLSDGYTIVMGSAESIQDAEGNTFAYQASTRLLVTAINGVSLANKTEVEATSCAKNITTTAETDEDGTILVGLNETPAFESASTISIGSLQLSGSADTTVEMEGDLTLTGSEGKAIVTDWVGTQKFDVKVKSLVDVLEATEMRYGAQVRTKAPYGLRFTMQMSAEDKALIEANVGEGKEFASVSYSMVILPYDYIATYGDVTAESLFGENATYTWDGKTEVKEEGKPAIIQKTSKEGLQLGNPDKYEDANTYYLHLAITELDASNVTRKFIGAGYLEFTRADGTKAYKVVTMYEDYVEGGDEKNNNVRSAYDVAKAAYEDVEFTDDTVKAWLLENYLTPNGYVVAE